MRGAIRYSLNTVGILASLLALGACGDGPGKDASAPPAFTEANGVVTVPDGSPLRQKLAIAQIGPGQGAGLEIPAQIEAEPSRLANLSTPLTGRVETVAVQLGQTVRKGQIIAEIASGDFASARADAEKADDAAELARRALARAQGVMAAGGAAEKDLEAAHSAYVQAASEQKRAHDRLAALNGSPSTAARSLVLRAPQDGVVTSLSIGKGSVVDDPTAVLATVVNTDRVQVSGFVAEQDFGEVKVGDPVDVVLNADPTHPLHGAIERTNAVLEADSRRQKVFLTLANPGHRLAPQMYAALRFRSQAGVGVYAPQSALLMNNDRVTVLVEARPWVFERRVVKLGDETADMAQIIDGLKAGERVVVRGGVLLND